MMTKDLTAGDPARLPELLVTLMSFEHVIAADPGVSAPTRAAWAAVQQAAASYAATCPDRSDCANPATLAPMMGGVARGQDD